MSTSRNDGEAPHELPPGFGAAAAPDALSAALAAMPDPALIAQVAREFFAALPALPAGAAAPAVPSLPGAGAGLEASAPFQAALSAAAPPQTVPRPGPALWPGVPAPPSTMPPPLAPAGYAASPGPAPGVAEAPWLPAAAGALFSFLEEARAIGAAVTPAPEPQAFRPDVVPDLGLARQLFDVQSVRRDFPILQERVHGRPLIWLDNAATTQKPRAVIDRLSYFYTHENSNIHRAAHTLAARSTDAYEAAREAVRRFLNAGSIREIVFVRGATEAINLVAQSFGRRHVGRDDEVVITWLEHHANIVPWQMLCAEKGARLRVAPVDDDGQVLLDEYEKLLGPRTRLVSLPHVSNALGTIAPVQEMIEMAHRHGARVLVDGAQAVSHLRVDVQALDCDWYVFSGHKVFAPTGIGVLQGKADLLDSMPPWHGGGNMIKDVTFEKTTYNAAPTRFEAGTGTIGDAVGLGAALDYLDQVGMENVTRHEHDLLVHGSEGLRSVPGLRLIGTAREKAGVLSFVLEGFRTEEIGAALDLEGIAVRAGHHCAQPILRRMGVESTVRPSLALYNTREDLDALVAALRRLVAGRGARRG